MNLENNYLTEQIIAYIGNKRKLLNLILKAIQETGIEIKPGLKFFDVFAGSGVVSRLAKYLNFEIYSNDWEYYSYIIANCYLKTNKRDIIQLFGSEDNFVKLLEKINSLPNPSTDEQYIAKYYAPKEDDINSVDYKTERLFYTHQNALNIDKIRNYIETEYPLNKISDTDFKKRNILLAELIYEAATHNNTSGVFKACHKEFGGHNKDALTRILGEIKLHEPILIDSDFPIHIYQKDSNELVKEVPQVDIAYLDPPYNQHQYGSNYHMLNTIAKWDHIPAELELNEKGVLKEKAAIRHDWVNTRSHYCYKEEATKAFEELITNLKADYILISYSTDGIIPFTEMQRICMQKGKVSIVTNEYTTYRGGKQSNKRQNTNIEFILCIDTKHESSKKTVDELDNVFTRKKCILRFKQKYSEERLKKEFPLHDDSTLYFKNKDKEFSIKTNNFFTLEQPDFINELDLLTLLELQTKLEYCTCMSKEEELSEIVKKLNGDLDTNIKFIKLIPDTLKKLAHKKNKLIFYKWLSIVREIKKTNPKIYSYIEEKVENVAILAERRFNN